MSAIQPPLERQKFFHSVAMPCPYLPGQIERKLFTELEADNGAAVNSFLTRAGFRRSHDIAYRPACDGCRACTPVRVPVGRAKLSHTQQRTVRRNADLASAVLPAIATDEQYALFERYQKGRHAGGDMSLMRRADYTSMIESGTKTTCVLEWRDAYGALFGAMLADEVGDGFSAVYSFFDPDQPRRSLGVFMVLSLIEQARSIGMEYVYLGYYIAGARKMEYKGRFKPLEALDAGVWRPL